MAQKIHRLHQRRAGTHWENLGIAISQVIKESGNGRANDLDMLFSGKKTMSGILIKSSGSASGLRI
jgi:hypothetical protein